MGFRSVAGQKEIITGLENSIINDKVVHACLFSGSKGIGKRTVAKIFAGLLLCGNPVISDADNSVEFCGVCFSCSLSKENSNPDFYIIDTEDNSIGVEEIRKLQSDIIIRPMYSKRKVYLIADADKMTMQAQNCLLKTLEEPPGYAVIILTSSKIDMLLETIHSRVIRYNFKKNTASEVRSVLQSMYGNGLDNIDFITAYSDGIIGTALDLAGSKEFGGIREQAIAIIQKLTEHKLLDIFEVYGFFEENKDIIDSIFDIMLLFYRDLLIAVKGLKENVLINSDKKDIILNNALRFSAGKLIKSIEIIETTRKNLKYNANYQLSIEIMLMKLQEDFC